MDIAAEFLEKGIVKIPVEDMPALQSICKNTWGMESFGGESTHHHVLDNIHQFLPMGKLNEFRLDAIKALNSIENVRHLYYSLAKSALHEIVGNELVMQRNINLSIQMPGDKSSLLPIHTDSLQGDSPFEIVLWVPLVDVSGTKSMFFCDKKASDYTLARLHEVDGISGLYEILKSSMTFMDVKFGECLIFSQNIFHGNVLNETNETRWSMNCRFKSLFSPYSDKKLGEFFEPIELRPATKIGLAYGRL